MQLQNWMREKVWKRGSERGKERERENIRGGERESDWEREKEGVYLFQIWRCGSEEEEECCFSGLEWHVTSQHLINPAGAENTLATPDNYRPWRGPDFPIRSHSHPNKLAKQTKTLHAPFSSSPPAVCLWECESLGIRNVSETQRPPLLFI